MNPRNTVITHARFVTVTPLTDQIARWFAGRVPNDWFTSSPRVAVDREEILVIGTLPDVSTGDRPGPDAARDARAEAVARFREATREQRMAIASEAERVFGRQVSWGAGCGDVQVLFTHLSVPVMTRLRLPERVVLDTLVAAGVARSRSDALAWCVRHVTSHEEPWLSELREALAAVESLRAGGPRLN